MVKEQASTILAFDVGGTRVKAGLVQGASVISAQTVPTSGAQTVATLLQLGRELMGNHQVQAVGISMKGIIDPFEGVIVDVNESLQSFQGFQLAAYLATAFKLPVFMENDARMYAWGELRYGAGRGYHNLICLTLGTGVGCGVVLNDTLLRGKQGTRGILGGHITIARDGERCSCGNTDCLELYIGVTGWLRHIQQLLPTQPSLLQEHPLDPPRVFAAAAEGDALAQSAVQQFTRDLSTGIVSLIHAYDPDLVIIGGGVAHASEHFLSTVQASVNERSWTYPRARIPVVVAQRGDVAALLGAADLARESIAFL